MELCVRFTDQTWRTIAEFHSKRVTWFEILDVCRAWNKNYHCERFWCDSSQLQSIQALGAAGIPAIATQIRDVEFRHRTLYSVAKQRRWRYNREACPQLHAEFQLFGYTRSRSGTVRFQQRNDHCIDAVTYAICSEGESPEPHSRDEIPPEDRAAYWRDKDGIRFDPKAVIAQAKKPNRDEQWEPTWDEQIEIEELLEDTDDEARMHWYYLTGGKPYPEPEGR
jgi:hypothetical protein